jgi:hypothetical protein
MAQTPGQPGTVSDQISITSDYVNSIGKNIEALGAQNGISSRDYDVASKNLRARISDALKKFEASMKNMVLIPMSRPIDSYNSTLTQSNLNVDVKKIELDSKLQVLASASTTYEAVYHQLLQDLYGVNPALLETYVVVKKKNKHGRYVTLRFGDGTESDLRFADDISDNSKIGAHFTGDWVSNITFSFRDSSGNTGPFATWPNLSQPLKISESDVLNYINRPSVDNTDVLAFLYPDYAYQAIYKECEAAASGAHPSQTCMTSLRGDYQEYFLEVQNILDREMKFELADGNIITLKNSESDILYSFHKLIVPSLAGIENPSDFTTVFPVSN